MHSDASLAKKVNVKHLEVKLFNKHYQTLPWTTVSTCLVALSQAFLWWWCVPSSPLPVPWQPVWQETGMRRCGEAGTRSAWSFLKMVEAALILKVKLRPYSECLSLGRQCGMQASLPQCSQVAEFRIPLLEMVCSTTLGQMSFKVFWKIYLMSEPM